MRCTQLFGLTDEAMKFLREHCNRIPKHACPNCGTIISTEIESWGYEDASHLGMFDDGPWLLEYKMKDDKILKEVEQETIWSSGPCIFLCLEDEEGNRLFEWDQSVIDNC